jgi:hypothetical protein
MAAQQGLHGLPQIGTLSAAGFKQLDPVRHGQINCFHEQLLGLIVDGFGISGVHEHFIIWLPDQGPV